MATNQKISQLYADNPLTEFNGNETAEAVQGGTSKGFLYTTLKTWLQTAFNSVYTLVADFLELEGRVDNIEKITSSLILYLDHSSSDISGYEQLLRTPLTTTLVTETVTINANEVLIDSYATILDFPGQTTIPAGVWTVHGNFQFSSVTGDNYIHWDVYKRTDTGTETLLFRMSSPDVTSTDEDIILVQAAQSEIILADGDRLVLKIYAETTGSSKTASMLYSNGEKFGFIQPPAFTVTLDHNTLLNVEAAGTGVTDGHITDAAQTIAGEKDFEDRVKIGDATIINNTGTGVSSISDIFRNAYLDGSTFKRLVADNNVGTIRIDANGDFRYNVQTDANTAVDSEITLATVFRIDNDGKIYIVNTPTAALATQPILFRDASDGEVKEFTQLKQTSITSSATPTPTGDARENELFITALAEDAVIAAPTGTALDGNKLFIRINASDSTNRSIGWNSIYSNIDTEHMTIPNATHSSTNSILAELVYNSTTVKWEFLTITYYLPV